MNKRFKKNKFIFKSILFLFLILIFFLTLNYFGILNLKSKHYIISEFKSVGGNAYTTSNPFKTQKITLLEEGYPLNYPNLSSTRPVIEIGYGRYTINKEYITFSASDNTNPNINKKTYSLKAPWPVYPIILQILYILFFIKVIIYFYLFKVRFNFFNINFKILFFFFTILFILNRLWFFIEYPIVGIHPDSGNYYALSESINTFPDVGIRPPLYPLFLKLVFKISDTLYALAIMQTMLTFLSASLLFYGMYLYNSRLGLFSLFGISIYVFGAQNIEHDTAMLSESLYTSCLLAGYGFLIIGILKNKSYAFISSSILFSFAILTRPAGLFLVITYVLLIVWLICIKKEKKNFFLFIIPFILLIGSISVYNFNKAKSFSPTTWGEANIAVSTFLYWQKDEKYPDEINRSIGEIRKVIANRFLITGKDIDLLNTSWNPKILGPIFVESFNAEALDIAMAIGSEGIYSKVSRDWIRKISVDSILKNKKYYFKFVFTMLVQYYKPIPDINFLEYLRNRAWLQYIVQPFKSENAEQQFLRMYKETVYEKINPNIKITDFNKNSVIDLNDRILLSATPFFELYYITHKFRKYFFENWLWPISIFTSLTLSALYLLRKNMKNENSFIILLITLSSISASLVVSLVEYSQPRYSYPMEWCYLFSMLLLINLIGKFILDYFLKFYKFIYFVLNVIK